MINKPLLKNIITIIVIPAVGYILLNVVFLFYVAIILLFQRIVYPHASFDEAFQPWTMATGFAIATVLVALISFLVLRSKLATIYKAIYLTVPVAVILVTLGMTLGHWQWLGYTAGAVVTLAILSYLYMANKSWLYYYSVIITALALLIFSLSGGEI